MIAVFTLRLPSNLRHVSNPDMLVDQRKSMRLLSILKKVSRLCKFGQVNLDMFAKSKLTWILSYVSNSNTHYDDVY